MSDQSYKTDKKEEIYRYTEDNELITVYRISATSKGGTKFHVDVPEAELDKADELLRARAIILDNI